MRQVFGQMDVVESIKREVQYRKRRSDAFCKCTYGDKNRDGKFRILRNLSPSSLAQGLISTIAEVLPCMMDARKQGYIPVVELGRNRHYQPMLQDREAWLRRENAWEYYFTQPEKRVSLEEVRESKYVERQIKWYRDDDRFSFNNFYDQSDRRWQSVSHALRQNIHLQEAIKDRVRSEKRKLFPYNTKILGVGIRAGYRRGILVNNPLYHRHAIVGTCEEYIRNIEKKLSEWKYDVFFLEVDDREYLEEIKRYFGASCICLDRSRGHYFKNALLDIPYSDGDPDREIEWREISIRKRNEDYLVELYLLALCDSLYASRGTGQTFVYLLNGGKYTHVEIDDLGSFNYKKQ